MATRSLGSSVAQCRRPCVTGVVRGGGAGWLAGVAGAIRGAVGPRDAAAPGGVRPRGRLEGAVPQQGRHGRGGQPLAEAKPARGEGGRGPHSRPDPARRDRQVCEKVAWLACGAAYGQCVLRRRLRGGAGCPSSS